MFVCLHDIIHLRYYIITLLHYTFTEHYTVIQILSVNHFIHH